MLSDDPLFLMGEVVISLEARKAKEVNPETVRMYNSLIDEQRRSIGYYRTFLADQISMISTSEIPPYRVD